MNVIRDRSWFLVFLLIAAIGKTDDPARPFLSLELRTGIKERPGGKPVDTSLHEDALLALWDSIASSIRLRKPGPRPVPGPGPAAKSAPVQQLAAH
jgi:hypothetical protein